eukprot:COSAG02_NODE_46844_length_345_cov_1.455285_2_plen_74_part_01
MPHHRCRQGKSSNVCCIILLGIAHEDSVDHTCSIHCLTVTCTITLDWSMLASRIRSSCCIVSGIACAFEPARTG